MSDIVAVTFEGGPLDGQMLEISSRRRTLEIVKPMNPLTLYSANTNPSEPFRIVTGTYKRKTWGVECDGSLKGETIMRWQGWAP